MIKITYYILLRLSDLSYSFKVEAFQHEFIKNRLLSHAFLNTPKDVISLLNAFRLKSF